jgi:hypothetical protein
MSVSSTAERAGGADPEPFRMKFDPGTIKHLGLQMYATLSPVIGELVANAWDAGASTVWITIPEGLVTDASVIVVEDDGDGMNNEDVREAYLIVGRDRRQAEESDHRKREPKRPLMGRKGIGKFAGFGIARKVEIETVRDGQVSRFEMDYDQLEQKSEAREATFPPLEPTGTLRKGTRVTLENITKFRTRRIEIDGLRRGLARRFSVIGEDFKVILNEKEITLEERDLKKLLEIGDSGDPYLWEYDEEIEPGTGWRVHGWIGSLDRTNRHIDGIQRGIVIMARGKLVQEPFVFNATVGQQYALSYIVGELHTEFVDEDEDTIGTTRNSLVWDTPANQALLRWGERQVNLIARQWAARRSKDNEARLKKNPHYRKFLEEAQDKENKRAVKVADKLIRNVVSRDIVGSDEEADEIVQLCIDFIDFDAFWDLAEDLAEAPLTDTDQLTQLFREWEIVEAKEMARVTRGRITTIEKLQRLVDENALEVPTLHNFLREFPWVLDPRWQMVDDEVRYSQILRDRYPEGEDVPEQDRRIDFLCVRESDTLVVVEIKRPNSRVSRKELGQIEDYVLFMRAYVSGATDAEYSPSQVVGYLLCGSTVDTPEVREKKRSLAGDNIYVRKYSDLLGMVKRTHREFLEKYEELRRLKKVQPESG